MAFHLIYNFYFGVAISTYGKGNSLQISDLIVFFK